LKTDQNAVDATDATRASRDCCSDVNAAWAWARKASKSMASACYCGCAGAGSFANRQTDKLPQSQESAQQDEHASASLLACPFPGRKLISNFI